jgi:hypothetical protein
MSRGDIGNNVKHVCTEGVKLSHARIPFIQSEQELPLLLSMQDHLHWATENSETMDCCHYQLEYLILWWDIPGMG